MYYIIIIIMRLPSAAIRFAESRHNDDASLYTVEPVLRPCGAVFGICEGER